MDTAFTFACAHVEMRIPGTIVGRAGLLRFCCTGGNCWYCGCNGVGHKIR